METVNEHIKRYSDWIVKCFATENLNLDYTMNSLRYLDKFLEENVTNGIPNWNGILYKDHQEILYGMGVYLGETLRISIPDAKWLTQTKEGINHLTGEFQLPNGTIIYPIARVKKRFENGEEDSIYPYGLLMLSSISSDHYWAEVSPERDEIKKKKWWRFW